MKRIARGILIAALIATDTSCGSERSNNQDVVRRGQEDNASVEGQPMVLKPAVDIAAILEAALNGDNDFIAQSIEQGFDVNTLDGDSAYDFALQNCHQDVVEILE